MLRTTLGTTAVLVTLSLQSAVLPERGPLLETWQFSPGAPHERLDASASDRPLPSAPVVLPHRVLAPNRSFWYATTANLPEGGALLVDADDGAQMFVDGVRVEARGRVFLAPAGGPRARLVVIRVLNNAMAGGLRSVRVLTPADARAAVERTTGAIRTAPWPLVGTPAFDARMPGPGQPCRFSAWADSQGGLATFQRVVTRLVQESSDVSLAAGDLVDDGSSAGAWNSFLDVLAPLGATTPLALVAGNHDYDGFYDTLRAEHYRRAVRAGGREPWFAWSCGPVRFMAVDMNTEFPIGIDPGSPQGRWIAAEAASDAWAAAAWRVLVVHQPPWSRSWSGYEGDEAVRTWVERLARGAGLDLVIAGHSHAYERLERSIGGHPVTVLITGGAGGSLEDPTSARLDGDGGDRVVVRHHYVRGVATSSEFSWDAVDLDGEVFDRHEMRRRPAR